MKRSGLFLLLGAIVALARAAVAPASSAAPAPAEVPGFTFVRTVHAISEYRLDSNGLSVLLLPEHSAPVLTFTITYRVGSRNEVTGTTGATHLLEHLMFKGSTHYDRAKDNNVDQYLERVGGNYNATTWQDRTNYYANIGSENLEGYMAIEADRMRNLLLREEDRRPEMTVVRNEFERGENSPVQALDKEIWAAAFFAHPYHHDTIGWRSDIEKVPIEKLREFYDTFYWPDNATVSVIGDFEPAAVLGLIKKYYGAYTRAPKPIPQVYTEEPAQSGPRRVTVQRAGELGVFAIANKICAGTDPDFPALGVLSSILGDGKNSRLYRALTDKNLSLGVQLGLGFNHDPSLHVVYVPLAPGATHEQVEQITLAEIERLRRDGVTAAEVEAAIAKRLADSAFQRDGSYAIASNLTENIAVGDWTTYYTVDERTKLVTPADVQRVAQRYFDPNQSTIGWYIALKAGGAPSATPAPATRRLAEPAEWNQPEPVRAPHAYRRPGESADLGPDNAEAGASVGPAAGAATKIASNIVRTKVAGLDLLVYRTGVEDVVTLRATLPAGDAFSPVDNPALAALTGQLLDKGTTSEDKFSIARRLEAVGATISFSVGTQMVEVRAKCLRKDVPLVASLIAAQLRTPAFTAEEFEKAKQQVAGSFRRRLEEPSNRASDAFSRSIYPLGHPNRRPESEVYLAAIANTKIEDVRAFHARIYGPAHLTLVAIGDLDSAQIQAEVARAFAGWTGGAAIQRPARAASADLPLRQDVFMADKTSVSVVIGAPSGLKYSDPDYQALRVGTAILGSGFTGRLMANVRDKEGLTYGIGSNLGNDTFTDGDWRIQATFAPDLLAKGLASTRTQLTQWFAQGVTADEVERRKSSLIGSFKVSLATTDGLATAIMDAINRGYDVDWVDQYPEKIRALTPVQVNAAIHKYLKPETMFTISAGTIPGAAPAGK